MNKDKSDNNIVGKKGQLKAILFLVIIMVITMSLFLKDYSLKEFISVLKKNNPYYLLVGFGMMLLFISCEALNIKIIMKDLKQDLSFFRSLGYAFIGFYFSSITPSSSGGQPAQIYYMKKDNLPVSLSSLTIFYTVFIYQIAMVLLGGIMAVFRFNIAFKIALKLKYLLFFGVLINIVFIFILFSLMYSQKTINYLLDKCVKIGIRLHLLKKSDEWMDKLNKNITAYHEKALLLKQHPVLFVKVLLITMVQLIALCLVPYMVYRSMGYEAYNAFDMITAQALLTLAVSAVPLPGSAGAAEGSFLYAFGIFFSNKVITSAMVLSRVISFYLPLFVSFLVYIIILMRTSGNFRKRS